MSTVDSLPRRVARSIAVAPSGCWVWLGGTNNGYGRLYAGSTKYAHRYVYETLAGPIADGLQIDHLCRFRRCVNPLHLEPVPQAVNIARGASPTAINNRKTACSRCGEALQERPSGYRWCRSCASQKAGDTYYRNRDRELARQKARRERIRATNPPRDPDLCLRGHRLTGPNLRLTRGQRPQRLCVACLRARGRLQANPHQDVRALSDLIYQQLMEQEPHR